MVHGLLVDEHTRVALGSLVARSIGAREVTAHVRPVFIEKASPQQNCQIERFNGTMRRETFNGELFHSVLEAKVVIEEFARLQHPTATPRAGWPNRRRLRQDGEVARPRRPTWWG
jgi:hypothetical protein